MKNHLKPILYVLLGLSLSTVLHAQTTPSKPKTTNTQTMTSDAAAKARAAAVAKLKAKIQVDAKAKVNADTKAKALAKAKAEARAKTWVPKKITNRGKKPTRPRPGTGEAKDLFYSALLINTSTSQNLKVFVLMNEDDTNPDHELSQSGNADLICMPYYDDPKINYLNYQIIFPNGSTMIERFVMDLTVVILNSANQVVYTSSYQDMIEKIEKNTSNSSVYQYPKTDCNYMYRNINTIIVNITTDPISTLTVYDVEWPPLF